MDNTYCFTEYYYLESEEDPVMFFHPTYGNISSNVVYLNYTLFTYSVAVLFNNDSSSSSCAILFVDIQGNLQGTTKFVNR